MATFTVNTHHAYLNNKIVIETKDWITIEDISTGLKYQFKKVLVIKLSAGLHILKSDDHEEEIVIEDAIKLGGSKIKYAFVFDDTPWTFVTTKDRLYITNVETHEEKIEYNITPDKILSLPAYDIVTNLMSILSLNRVMIMLCIMLKMARSSFSLPNISLPMSI